VSAALVQENTPTRSAYNVPMKVTRRGLARLLAVTAAVPAGVSPQVPASAASSDALANAARDEYREAGRALSAVNLPRSLEPATRFEA
jgi:hypothetical protein